MTESWDDDHLPTTGASGAETGRAGTAETKEAGVAPSRERRRLESEFLLAMRRAGSVMQLLSAASAERIGINVTDLNCLNILALSGRMTAGDLARVSGLTTASITGVIDRLEEAGFVRRERDATDRRRVLVHLDPARGLHDIAPVFMPVVAAWRAAVADYTDEQVGFLLDFQHQIEEIMRSRLIELRGGETG